MFQPLDGPGVSGSMSVSTVVEAKVGASRLEDRKVLTLQPTDGDIYFGYSASETTSSGTKIFMGQVYPLEATDSLPVYIIAASGTVNVRVTEVA